MSFLHVHKRRVSTQDVYSRVPSLETIVPLNRRAVNALALAYAEMAGTWRDDYELERRKLRDTRRASA